MTYDVLRHRSLLVLLVALPLFIGACDILLGLETPQVAAIDAAAAADAASADATSAAPDAAAELADAAEVVDAPDSVPDAMAPPPDADVPDACVGQLACSNGSVLDTCTGELFPCPDNRCCNRGEGIVHCLSPGEVCPN